MRVVAAVTGIGVSSVRRPVASAKVHAAGLRCWLRLSRDVQAGSIAPLSSVFCLPGILCDSLSADRRQVLARNASDAREGRMTTWTDDELNAIDGADEMEIASLRRDGSMRKPVIIWVVRVGDRVFVRSAYGPNAA
jgi:hypothetical protein